MRRAFILSGVLVGVVALGWVGLRVPPGVPKAAELESRDLGPVRVPSNLPTPVARFVAAVGQGPVPPGATAAETPRYETAIQYGHGRMHIAGPWIPYRVEVASRLGEERHSDMKLTWFGLGIVSGVDDYIAGRGRTQIAGRDLAEDGDALDQGAYLAVKAEQIGFPGSWIEDPLVRWEEGGHDHRARLVLTRERRDGTTERESFEATFDPETGFLAALDTMRHRDATSGKVPWRVELSDWRDFAPSGQSPLFAAGRIEVTWMNDGGPWLVQHLDRIETNVPVEGELVW